jgi:hypothetical protein
VSPFDRLLLLPRLLFRRVLLRREGHDLTSAWGDLTQLTPGDFHVVQRKADILGVEDPPEFAVMLMSESAAKPGRTRPIGF